MTYVPVHQELPRHRKVRKLSRILELKPWETIGLLVSVWVYAVEFACDGVIDDFEDLADAVGWERGVNELADALRQSGFLDESQLHDWDEYGGRLMKRKMANAERMKVARAGSSEDTESARAEHVQRTCETRAEPVSKGVNKNSLTGVLTDETTDETAENGVSAEKRLSDAAQAIPDWKTRADDGAFFRRLLEDFTEEHITTVIRNLSIHQAANHKYKNLRSALGNWMKRETPDPKPLDEQSLTPRQRFCVQAIRGEGFDASLTTDMDELHELKALVLGGITEAEVVSWQ